METYFENFTFKLTAKEAFSAFHSGQCEKDVEKLLKLSHVRKQFKKLTDKQLTDELIPFGAWDKKELENRSENEKRVLWLAACNIVESLG
jgi:hypothetical protein